MLAIRQVYNNAPAMIPIPEAFRHGNAEVILLLQENTKIIPENELKNAISMFYGIIIRIYLLDNKHHNLPHIHAKLC